MGGGRRGGPVLGRLPRDPSDGQGHARRARCDRRALALTHRPPRQALWAAGGIATLSLALFLAEHVVPNALLVVAVPAGVVAGIACRRRPEIAILALFAIASAFGVIDAFTPIPPSKLADLLLAGLWLGVAWRRIAGGERSAIRLLPGSSCCWRSRSSRSPRSSPRRR